MTVKSTRPRRATQGRVRAAKPAMIKRIGRWIDVSEDGCTPLDPEAYALLTPHMKYRFKRLLMGQKKYNPVTDEYQQVVMEPRRLYHFDPKGRLICGAGYTDRVYHTLRHAGFAVTYVDLTDDIGHPDRYVANWKRLEKHAEFAIQPGDRERLDAVLAAGEIPDVSLARRVVQREMIEVADRRISKRLGGLFKLPPGFGKTHSLAAFAMLYSNARIGITAPSVDIVESTVAHLQNFIPMVGQVGGGKRERQHRVTVYTADSLHLLDENTDLLFIDEAHEYVTDKRKESILRLAKRAVIITLTATPEDRLDGAHVELEPLSGPIVHEMTWQEAVRLGLILQIEVRWIPIRMSRNPVEGIKDIMARKRHGIWRNKERNAQIAAVMRNHPETDQKLVMVATLEHAVCLAQLLPDFQLCYGTTDLDRLLQLQRAGYIDDSFEPVDREIRSEIRRDFAKGTLRKVIATDVWSRGVSFDALAVVCRADARSSAVKDEQIPGRASRVHNASGKALGILYDCDDAWDSGFRAGTGFRRNNYRSKGWEQVQTGRAGDDL